MNNNRRNLLFAVALAMATASALPAQTAQAPSDRPTKPSLIVVISVDQLSSDLFNELRPHFTGGLKKLSEGVVFPKGYQSHAATETCPGHSTILTGARPARTGIIANKWIDQSVSRADKLIYCAEDPEAPGATAKDYVPSLMRLRVPTLGDRMKALDPRSQVYAVAGKDRAAMMMSGKGADGAYWWSGNGFASYRGTALPPVVDAVNARVATSIAAGHEAHAVPAHCAPFDRAVAVTTERSVGTGRFARDPGDAARVMLSPEGDVATLALAEALVDDRRLGGDDHSDILAIGLSATDIVGHLYGTAGLEMCIQLAELDSALGRFLARLDTKRIDYVVTLTADHGGLDLPERSREHGIPDAARIEAALTLPALNEALARETGLAAPLILGDGAFGDMYLHARLSSAERKVVAAAALRYWQAHPQVSAVFTKDELVQAAPPSGPPEIWPLLQIAKASFDPERSGDFVVLLKPRITPIANPGSGAVATHGSPWDYDRRVPILFWRKGLAGFEQPLGIETVDIMPTLAAILGLAVPADEIDGRCLDLIAGPKSSCPAP